MGGNGISRDTANANRGTRHGRELVRRSLEKYGAGRSILLDRDGVVIAGNKTHEQAEDIGLPVTVVETDGSELVAVKRTDVSIADERGRGLSIADNRTAEAGLMWDPEMLRQHADTVDLTEFWSVAALRSKFGIGLDEPDTVEPSEALAAKWGVERGQIWALGRHRLMCGDATAESDVAALLCGHRPLLCVTDPPYGVDYDPGWRERAAEEGRLAYAARRVGRVEGDLKADWREAWALFPGDVIYSWHAALAKGARNGLEAAGFEVRSQIIWSKPHLPISRAHYHWRHEPCWYAVRRGAKAHWIGDRAQSTVWQVPLDANVAGGHSTQKPVELMSRAIANHTGDVYEPFCGTGSTIIASERFNRTCYALDIDPGYVAATLERWHTAQGEKPELADGQGDGGGN